MRIQGSFAPGSAGVPQSTSDRAARGRGIGKTGGDRTARYHPYGNARAGQTRFAPPAYSGSNRWDALYRAVAADEDFVVLANAIFQVTPKGSRPGPIPDQIRIFLADRLREARKEAFRRYQVPEPSNLSRWNVALGKFARLLPFLGKKGNQDVSDILYNLWCIVQDLYLCSDRETLLPRTLATLLYNCKGVKDSQDARDLLWWLAKHIACADQLSPQEIGNALYGLQGMSDSEHARAVMGAIAEHIARADQLDAQAIGNALYGLQGMSDSAEARAVMGAIAEHIKKAEKLSAQAIGNALYGLQRMSDSSEAQAVMGAIAKHIENAEQLSAQQIGNALYGLQGMSDSEQAQAVMGAIAEHIKKAEKLGAQEISIALYGLQGMSDSEQARAVMGAIAEHIENAEQLSAQHIGNALYGLQGMSDSEQAQAVMGAIAEHIKKAKQLRAQEIGNALYGLQEMSDSEQAQAVMRAIAEHIARADQLDAQAIVNALYGLRNKVESPALFAVLDAMREVLRDKHGSVLYCADCRASSLYVAEAIHSLRQHAGHPVAQQFLVELIKRVKNGPEVSIVQMDAGQQDEWLFSLLYTESGKIDLHGLSHAQAEWMVTHALARANAGSIDVITGRASHRARNKGRMLAIVTEVAVRFGWQVWQTSNPGVVQLYPTGR